MAQACASCGCSLSPDWVTSSAFSGTGFKMDVRYDYLNQNQLRSGTKTISQTDASQIINPNGEPQEVEEYTKNQYFTLGFDYSPTPDWGVNLQLPYIVRSHSTLGTFDPVGGQSGQYESKTSSVGDVKLVGRYLGLTARRNLAVSLGLKLPTGSHTKTGTSTDPANPGPVDIDRGLQPGTGTTDAIVGVSYTDSLVKDWDYLAQGLFQSALNSSDDYRPGNGFNMNLGLRYTAMPSFQPQLQLNVRYAKRDSGANADTVSTGGALIYLSPGFSAPINKQASVYGYAQLPIYQNVNGVQLTPRFTASVGLHYAF